MGSAAGDCVDVEGDGVLDPRAIREREAQAQVSQAHARVRGAECSCFGQGSEHGRGEGRKQLFAEGAGQEGATVRSMEEGEITPCAQAEWGGGGGQ